MAAGHARAEGIRAGRRVRIVGENGLLRWSEVWEYNPWIVAPQEPAAVHAEALEVRNGPNARPYIREWITEDGRPRAVFSDWKARDYRGSIHFIAGELARALEAVGGFPFLVLEHRIGGSSSMNKDWGAARFQQVVDMLEGKARFVTLGPDLDGDCGIEGTIRIQTASFREAAAVLSLSGGYVGVEGGMHHAAAALGKPAAVIFGHFAPPAATGYPDHVNYAVPGAGCGRWAPCGECAAVLAAIDPVDVAERALQMFRAAYRKEAV